MDFNHHIIKKLKDDLSRRGFLKLGLIASISGFIPRKAIGAVKDLMLNEKALTFYNTHTEENLHTVFWQNGNYLPGALTDINYILRDHYCDVVKAIDTKLLDLLFALKQKLNCCEPFHIISGYRTATTNARLKKHKRGVATKSLHIEGKAIDVRLPGYNLEELKSAAYELMAGGVCYYPSSNFIHLDIGHVRFW